MGKINNLKMEQIFKTIGSIFFYSDIAYFIEDKDVLDKYVEIFSDEKNYNISDVKKFLIENESKINKEKLVFVIYLNFKENLKIIDETINRLSKDTIKNTEKLYKAINERKLEEKYANEARNLLKDTDIYLFRSNYMNGKLFLDLYSSKEEINGKKKSEKKNLERLKQIDEELGNGEQGSIYLLQLLVLSDLNHLLPDKQLGAELREYILNKAVAAKGEYSIKQLIDIKNDDYNKYVDIIDSIEPEYYLPEFRKELIKNIRFIDIDKLLLLISYRLDEYLENVENPDLKPGVAKYIIEYIKPKIKNKNFTIDTELEKRVTYEPEHVQYGYRDLERLSNRIISNSYIKKSEIENTKIALKSGNISLNDIEEYLIGLLELNNKDFEEIMGYNDENFIYVVERLNLSQEKILEKILVNPDVVSLRMLSYLYNSKKINLQIIQELYSKGIISRKFFKEFSSENDISEELNLQKINEQYIALKKQKESKQEETEQLEKLVELYKIINVQERTTEELQEVSDNVMYELAENFEDVDDVLFYFENGLITLDTMAEWTGENLIEDLYNKSKITFEDIEALYKSNKISIELIQRKISIDNMDYTTLIANIMNGYVSENRIIDLYMQGRIFDADFENMAMEGKVRIDKYFDATSKRTKDVLEKNAKIKFKPILYNIPDKKIKMNVVADESSSNGPSYAGDNKNKTLIDPNARYELLKLLGAKEAEAVILDENSAFYNYEFFVIPDSQGNLQENSVVIAERFYEDKDTKEKFSLDNATYFFQYKDLMVNSNLSKKDMIQNRKNIVFTANHRAGSWAVSVLYKLAQTMASNDFKQYKNSDQKAERLLDELHKIYSSEEIKNILELTGRIDDTNEYIYEVIDSRCGKKSKNDGEER